MSRSGVRIRPILLTMLPLLAIMIGSEIAQAQPLPGARPQKWPANPEKHQVVIDRPAKDEREAELIAAAEAAQPSLEAMQKALDAPDPFDPLGLNSPKEKKLPEGEKVWWYQERLGIRIPAAITTEAITYYSELVEKNAKRAFTRYVEPSSRLEYRATIELQEEFKLNDKTFQNVHVVTLQLTFSQNFTTTESEGMHFQKTRIVILDRDGEVLEVSGDGPTEVPVLAI